MQLNSFFSFLGMNASAEADAAPQAGAPRMASGFGAMLASTLARLSPKKADVVDAAMATLPGHVDTPMRAAADSTLGNPSGGDEAAGGIGTPNTGPGETLDAAGAESDAASEAPLIGTFPPPVVDDGTNAASGNGAADRALDDPLKPFVGDESTSADDQIPEERLNRNNHGHETTGRETPAPVRPDGSAEQAVGTATSDEPVRLDTPSETPPSEPANAAGKDVASDVPLPSDADLQQPDPNATPVRDDVPERRRGGAPAGQDVAPTASEGDAPSLGNTPLQDSEPIPPSAGSMDDAERTDTSAKRRADDVLRPTTGSSDAEAFDSVTPRNGNPERMAVPAEPTPKTDPPLSQTGSSRPAKFDENPDEGRVPVQREASPPAGRETVQREASPPTGRETVSASETRTASATADRHAGAGTDQAERLRAAVIERASHHRPADRIRVWQEASTGPSTDAKTARAATSGDMPARAMGAVDAQSAADGAPVKDATANAGSELASPAPEGGKHASGQGSEPLTKAANTTPAADAALQNRTETTIKPAHVTATTDTTHQNSSEPEAKPANSAAPRDLAAQISTEPAAKAASAVGTRETAKHADVEPAAKSTNARVPDDRAPRGETLTKAPIAERGNDAAPRAAAEPVAKAVNTARDAGPKSDPDLPAQTSNVAEATRSGAEKGTANSALTSSDPTFEAAAASAGRVDERVERETRADADRSNARPGSSETIESGKAAKGQSGDRSDFMAESHTKPDDAFDVAADELSQDGVEFDAALHDETASPDVEVPVDLANSETTERLTFTPERIQPTANTNPLAEAARTARSRQPGGLNWMRAMLAESLEGFSLEDDWKVLEMKLDEGQGTMTVRARRDEDKMSITVNFSDPQLRALAAWNSDRLQETLSAQYQTQVDFSLMNDNHSQQRRNEAPDDGNRGFGGISSAARSSSISGADLARATRAALAGARNEWVG